MKVYLVRHGQALSASQDPARPLSAEGRREIGQLARTLAQMHLTVGRVIHSGRLRAEETARLIAGEIEVRQGVSAVSGLGPEDRVDEALELIEVLDQDLMIVGHNPFLANLLAALVKPADFGELPGFDCGSLVAVERVEGRWQVFRRLGPRMFL